MVEKLLVKSIATALEKFRAAPLMKHPSNPFTLVSSISILATSSEVRAAWSEGASDAELLWFECRQARLFEDSDYGQWGLALLDPQASALRTKVEKAARPTVFREGDVIIGEFLGDQELLVIAPSEVGGRRILVALPLDDRCDWFGAASDLGEFLDDYFEAQGNKFWEHGVPR
jgi:hypothetical protein